MGKWLEIFREKPSGLTSSSGNVVTELAPNPLISASRLIGRKAANEFPALHRLRWDSGEYVDEELWLSPKEAERVLHDFQRLRKIGKREEFSKALDSGRIQQLWKKYDYHPDIEQWLNKIEEILEQAVTENFWTRITL